MITPLVSPEIYRARPDFAALSITVTGARNAPSDVESIEQLRLAATAEAAPWSEAHLEAWREAYRAFGLKPQRTPCSADALHKRVQRDGSLPTVNAIVDLYNAISLRYALPVGGEDAALYAGAPSLVVAAGGEPFDTVQNGEPVSEAVDPGEVVWRDDRGVTCRRWNWRQGLRTRISEGTTSMWFVLERLGPMPLAELQRAGDELVVGLRRLSPSLQASMVLLQSPSEAARNPVDTNGSAA